MIITKKKIIALAVLLVLDLRLCNLACAQHYTAPQPGHTRLLIIPTTAHAPLIDGKLDDIAWNSAAVARDFWASSLSMPPSDRTEVFIQSDGMSLYFGFRCYDSQPDAIQATKTRRDAGLGYDDKVSVELDSYLNHRTISTYSVNANGTQNDAIAGGRARKIEWKGDWKAAAVRTEYGWSAEIAIPYSILNYHSDSRNFGVNFIRYQNRTKETSYWADVTPQYKNEEMGQLRRLNLPTKVKDNSWTVMPYVLAGVNIPDINGEEKDRLAYAGADIRYEPAPNLTAVLSLYPDFNQLETQVTDIDFSYTEKFRPDPRPFFQEGSFYLGNNNSYFYSNRIEDFYAGGKLFTQQGGTQYGGFVTSSPDERRDGAFRIMQEFDPLHSVGLFLVGTSRMDLDNQLIVAQLDNRERSGLFYAIDAAYSDTAKQQDIDTGNAYSGKLGWQTDYWLMQLSADYYDKEYFPANALFNQDRYATRSINASINYSRELGDGFFRKVSANYTLTHRDTMDDRVQNYGSWVSGSTEISKPQMEITLSYYDADYRPLVDNQRGEFSDSLNQDYYWAGNLDFNTHSSIFGYGAYYAEGFLSGGDYKYVTGYIWIKPTNNTFLNISEEHLDNFGAFKQSTIKGGWDITPQDGIVLRYINADELEYNRVAYRHTVRSGMDVFAVYDKEPLSKDEFSVKLVWVF